MTTNLNTSPYYDDFSDENNFHQILFKPGYAVQARELTQLQSILRDQVAKFGNHIFKHGSVVIPGNSNSDLNVCYIKLAPTTVDVSALEGKTIIGGTTGLRSIIRKGINATVTDPATLYVSYYNSGINNEKLYLDSESLDVESTALAVSGPTVGGSVGGASMAFISPGVFYVNGSFVSVQKQSIVIGKYTTSPSCHVLLKIAESIVNSDNDSSLLDPAQGSYNYAAPGADRLKIELTLTSLPLGSSIDSNYIEIMRYNDGILEEHLRYPKYSELEKSLARRTSDESGDYVVAGLGVSVRDHIRSGLNGGRYLPDTGSDALVRTVGDPDKLVVTVGAGKAYLLGFEHELFSSRELIIDKTRDADHIKTISANISPSYGQTFYVTNITGLPNFLQRTTVDLYNASTGGSIMGSAKVISLDYYSPNTTETNAIFKLCVSDVAFNVGYDVADVGRISFVGGNFTILTKLTVIANTGVSFVAGEVVTSGARSGTVHKYDRTVSDLFIYKHSAGVDVPVIGDNISAPSTANGRVNSSMVLTNGSSNNLFVRLPTNSTYRVKNGTGATDMSYKIFYETTITTDGSGSGSFSVTGMTIDPKEQGNFIISSSDGVLLPLSVATVSTDGLSVNFNGAGNNKTLKIVCAATKSGANASPKSKTYVAGHQETGITPATNIALDNADIIRVVSITSSIEGNVTSRYTLDNGQRDYAYLLGTLSLTPSSVLPTGVLEIVYDYFAHNSGSGDYFSIDSYEFSGMSDYYDSPVMTYQSQNTGKSYNMRNLLDFRSKVGSDGLFTSPSASLSRAVQSDSRLTTSIQQYVGRIDAVVLNKRNDIMIIRGVPAIRPVRPKIPNGVLYLCAIVLPPYIFSVTNIRLLKQNNRVYTMKDIGGVAKRLSNLEEYVLVNEAEKFAVNYDIVDTTTGLSRYKSGYLVDTFNDPNIIGDTLNPKFRATYDSGLIIPMFEVTESPIFISSSDANVNSKIISLPYTHVEMISQPVSSKITNINPFAVFAWNGAMVLFPEVDTWVEVENLPQITVDTTETITVRRPYPGPFPGPIWDGTPDLRVVAPPPVPDPIPMPQPEPIPWIPVPPIPVHPDYSGDVSSPPPPNEVISADINTNTDGTISYDTEGMIEGGGGGNTGGDYWRGGNWGDGGEVGQRSNGYGTGVPSTPEFSAINTTGDDGYGYGGNGGSGEA